jgi:hypothetical protein
MTDRILEFLRNRREDGPCLALGHDVVRDNYAATDIDESPSAFASTGGFHWNVR